MSRCSGPSRAASESGAQSESTAYLRSYTHGDWSRKSRRIAAYGVVDGRFAYEVDGLGNALFLDDANVPSLLSLPYLGFCAPDDPVYRATRAWALSPHNPCWAHGRVVHGVGSRHTRRGRVWPLAIAMEGLTARDEDERDDALRRLELTVTGELLLHESVDPNDPRRFSRRWFSWADMLYVELVLVSARIGVPVLT